MKSKRFAIDIVLREVTAGRSRRLLHAVMFQSDSRAAADHIMAQVCDYPANWSPRQKITDAWETFETKDRYTLQQEGHHP